MLVTFEQWFASYLEQDESEVTRLLKDETAKRFLIAWSIFESKCFDGFVKVESFDNYVQKIVSSTVIDCKSFTDILAHFHSRYQDVKLYNNLMHKQKSNKLQKILTKDISNLKLDEVIFFLVFVVYRYRNNIFHGNKGVESWLQFKPHIERCIRIMQILIDTAKKSHNKALNCTLLKSDVWGQHIPPLPSS